jgi:hypothetical protein
MPDGRGDRDVTNENAQAAEPADALRRRDILLRAAMLVGGVAAVSSLTTCFRNDGAEPGGASSVAPVSGAAGQYFSAARMASLTAIVDVIIPRTATPGAVDAGVPAFMDMMMATWASATTRAQYDRVIDAMDEAALQNAGRRLASLDDAARLDAVRSYDALAFGRGDNEYKSFKQLVLLGYYHSEPGATEELQYELVPGEWIACAPLTEIGRAWADV